MKNKETIEEASKNYTKDGTKHFMEKTNVELGFIAGAKWQAEKMYSEEEVLNILNKRTDFIYRGSYTPTIEWFEQFKKK